jgi:zinc protease
VIADFLKTGPDPAALDRIRTQVRAGDIYSRDDVNALARRYGEGLSIGLTIDDIESWDEALAAVTEADIMAAAQRVFDRRNAVTGWLVRPDAEPTAASATGPAVTVEPALQGEGN